MSSLPDPASLLTGEDWGMLRRALQEPVDQLLYAQCESHAQIQALIEAAPTISPVSYTHLTLPTTSRV